MSRFMQRVARLFTNPASDPRRAPDPETMPLRDWADLPVYHPYCERVPR